MKQNSKDIIDFFNGDVANQFDDSQKGLMPGYELIFQTMEDVLDMHFKEKQKVEGWMLDIGAGTGNESMKILQMPKFSQLKTLAIDSSNEMKNLYETKFNKIFPTKSENDYRYLNHDITSMPVAVEADKKNKCKIALSGYTIHHFHTDEKREIYKLMYDFLEPGGLMLNIDLFTFESKQTRQAAHEFDIKYIEKHITDEAIKDKWINHYNNKDNNESQNALDPIGIQIDMLKEMGFVDVECVFRYWQQGVIRATKPKEGEKSEKHSLFHLAKKIKIKNELLNGNKTQLQEVTELDDDFKKELKQELGVIAVGISILSKADEDVSFLIESNVPKISVLGLKANNNHNFSISHKDFKIEEVSFDDFINFLYYVGRGTTIKYPEYLNRIKEDSQNKFENKIQCNLRKKYETLHISAGEILLFTLIWRYLIGFIKTETDLNLKIKTLRNHNATNNENLWENNPFSEDNNEYYLLEKLKELKQQEIKTDTCVEKNIINSWDRFLILLSNKDTLLINEFGLNIQKNKDALEEYVYFLFKEDLKINDNSEAFINILLLKLLPLLFTNGEENPTIKDFLKALHENARVPIIPFYFLMLCDSKKELKEQIVFPMLHTFSEEDTMYQYKDKNQDPKYESAVMHTMWIVKPIKFINNSKEDPWYSGNFSLSSYIQLLHEITSSVCAPILDEYYEKEHKKNFNQLKNHAFQATASRLINRNSAHHLISHCEPYVTFEKISDFLGWNKDGEIPARFIKTVESMRNRYRKYVNDRYTFMSQDLHNLGSVNAYLFKDIIGPLIENTLWVDGIARDEGYGYNIIPNGTSDNKDYSSIENYWSVDSKNNLVFTVNVQKNHNELSELYCNYQFETEFGNGQKQVQKIKSDELPYFFPELKNDSPNVINRKIVNDIQVTLPGSLGAHSFYSIIENHVRNLVKHKKLDSQQKPLKIKIEIKNIVESEINNVEKEMYDLTGLTNSNPINQTLRRSNELYQVELSSNLATLTDEEYKSLVTKVIQQYDLSDYDNIAKGLADIRLNAMLLSGAELKNDNPELATCLLADRTKLGDNQNILKYIFFIRKPYIAVQLGSINGITEDRKLGFYCFNDIEAYNNYLGDRQCPFSFMITTKDIANKLSAKQKPLKLILNPQLTYTKELDLWKEVCKPQLYRLFSNLTTGRKNNFMEIDANENNPFSGTKNIVYDRHGNYTREGELIFWEMFGKSNADFDIIDTEFKHKKDSIYYEMVFAATQQILIIDERVSGFAVDEHDKTSKKTINNDIEDKTVFANAAAAQIDIVTHFDTFPIQPNQVKTLGVIKMNANNELEYNNCQKKYDIVIIHRKLVDQFIKLILNVGSISDESYVNFISEMKKYCNQVYITTGSGSISDLKILAVEYKYIPYSIVEQYMRKAIMKISLLRNL